MTEPKKCTEKRPPEPRAERVEVKISVPADHPLMKLKAALPWEEITKAMVEAWREAGKNVDGKPGQRWPVELYVPLLVLMLVRRLTTREMEWYVAESAVARLFCGVENWPGLMIRDHANIARAMAALGSVGVEAVNRVVIEEAVKVGFADPKVLSADTTVQELPIGYPHEAGILRGIAQRCQRAAVKMGKAVVEGVAEVVEAGREVVRSAKQYHLFAKTKTEKEGVLRQMISQTQTLLQRATTVVESVSTRTERVIRSGVATLRRMQAVAQELIPQIEHWVESGKVARNKVLHAGISQARAYVRHKVGKTVEFGFKYLIGRLGGGYLFGQRVTQHSDTTMPVRALAAYRQIRGPAATPDLVTFDRGGHSGATIGKLQRAGIPHIGIQPKGQANWLVSEAIQAQVASERARMEGSIGTLKSPACGFNRPKERSLDSLLQAGQRSFLGLNLTLFLNDLTLPARSSATALA